MASASIYDLLSKTFSTTGKDRWLKAASFEVEDENFFKNLYWTVDDLTFSPYYDKDDLNDTEYLKAFHQSYQLIPDTWLNVPEIRVINESEANAQALHMLMKGADGISFDVSGLSSIHCESLLKKIDWNHCSISFKCRDTEIATEIFAYAQGNYNLNALTGSLFVKSNVSKICNAVSPCITKDNQYHWVGLHQSPLSPVQEISDALVKAVQVMEETRALGLDASNVFRSMSLAFTCSKNFLINVVKLKAMRILWYQLSQSFEIFFAPSDLHIHSIADRQLQPEFEPHGQMIQNTVEGISAILGGCNALTVSSSSDESSMTDRVALNVSNILKEECHLDRVKDPLAGSFAVDNMVDKLCRATWSAFQKSVEA